MEARSLHAIGCLYHKPALPTYSSQDWTRAGQGQAATPDRRRRPRVRGCRWRKRAIPGVARCPARVRVCAPCPQHSL